MKVKVGASEIELVRGDITQQDTDVVVNAANTSLLGGGGVDGAIHRAGGPAILEECRKLHGCKTGDAKITSAGRLRAKYVVHTVGPVYRDGEHCEPEMLASAHRRSLEVSLASGARSVAFPAISTGIYGYPCDEAATVAVSTVAKFLEEHQEIQLVRFVLYSTEAYEAFVDALDDMIDLPVIQERLRDYEETGRAIPWEQIRDERGIDD